MTPPPWMSRWMWIGIALVLVPGLAPGCGKKEDPGPPCTQVADHVNEVVSKAYPGHGDMMPANGRKAWVASCEARKLTGKQRRCMLDAQSAEALASCMPREKVEEKKPEGTRIVPVPSGGTTTPPAATTTTPPAAK